MQVENAIRHLLDSNGGTVNLGVMGIAEFPGSGQG